VLRKAVKVERRDVLAEKKDEAAAKVTFREAARQYHAENKAGWKSAVYARQWLASLENYAFAKTGCCSDRRHHGLHHRRADADLAGDSRNRRPSPQPDLRRAGLCPCEGLAF